MPGQLHGAADVTHAASHPALRASGEELDKAVIRALSHGRIEVDHLDLREGCETLEHLLGRVAFERLFTALDELDDLAAHQVDAGNDHMVVLTGMPCWSRNSFRSRNGVSPVVKHRRRQRGIRFAIGQHTQEILRLAGAARSDHRDLRRARNGARQFAIEPGPHAVGIH